VECERWQSWELGWCGVHRMVTNTLESPFKASYLPLTLPHHLCVLVALELHAV
jgi:hypothetical protein